MPLATWLRRLVPSKAGAIGLSRLAPLLGLVPALICALLALWEPFPVGALRDLVFDSYQRLSPRSYNPELPVRIIALDDESLQRIGQWPWPRAKIAALVERLTEAGAGAIAIDVLFSEPERATEAEGTDGGDARLERALAASPSVLGMVLVEQGAAAQVKAGFASAGDDPRLFVRHLGGALQPIPALREAAKGIGAMNITPDRDLVIREIPTLFAVQGALVPSLDMEALRVAQGAAGYIARASNASSTVGGTAFGEHSGITDVRVGAIRAPTTWEGTVRIHYSGSKAERRIPAWRILAGDFDKAAVEGAIVLIGITAAGFDIRATPVEPVVPGVEIRAEMVENVLTGGQLSRPDYMRVLEALVVLVGALFAVAAAARMSPLLAAVVTVTLVVLFVGCSAVAFVQLRELLNPVWPSLGSISTLGVATLVVLRQTEAERRQVREAFSRYVSPAVVEVLSRDPSKLALGGENRILTVLFSDIRGFTSRSEVMAAEDVVRFLNEVHTPMTEHVLETGGTLDKFIGDGMMAFWNAPLDHPDHVRAALRCALRMQVTVDEINSRLKRESEAKNIDNVPLGLGIGIHTGPACIGNIGSIRRFDYSAIGDSVNTAARLEPMCKTYGVGIIVSSDVVEQAPDFAYLLLDVINLKGKAQATRLYALVGDVAAVTADFAAFRAAHDAAVLLALDRGAGARAALRTCAAHPLGTRCRQLYEILEARLPQPAPDLVH